jgi:hypothetical protein
MVFLAVFSATADTYPDVTTEIPSAEGTVGGGNRCII